MRGYFQGLASGDGPAARDASGRYDVFADLDFGKMRLVKGLGFHVHGEGRFGDPRPAFGGQLWPANVGATLPVTEERMLATAPLGQSLESLATAFEAIDDYRERVHRDLTVAQVVLTRPELSTTLEQRLLDPGWHLAAIESTDQAFVAIGDCRSKWHSDRLRRDS